MEESHNEIDNWKFILIDNSEIVEQLRRRGYIWQYMLCTFAPANERVDPFRYNVTVYTTVH